jgi:hypothetical protein
VKVLNGQWPPRCASDEHLRFRVCMKTHSDTFLVLNSNGHKSADCDIVCCSKIITGENGRVSTIQPNRNARRYVLHIMDWCPLEIIGESIQHDSRQIAFCDKNALLMHEHVFSPKSNIHAFISLKRNCATEYSGRTQQL